MVVPNQRFVAISCVSPAAGDREHKKIAVKVHGAFATAEEAKAHVQTSDARVNIYILEMYRWACLPDPEINDKLMVVEVSDSDSDDGSECETD